MHVTTTLGSHRAPDTAITVFVMAFLAVGIRWKSLSAGGFEEVESHGI
jgi:hypothetical protein